MKRLLLPLLAVLALPTAVNAFWGLSQEEKNICRDRASRERNEFSAKQAYNYCKKNIKSELKKGKEYKKKYRKWYEEVGKNGCRREEQAYKNIKGDSWGDFADQVAASRYLEECKQKLRESKKEYGL